jgi:hypothetical protein
LRVSEVATEIKEAAVRTGLVINEDKEKYMRINIIQLRARSENGRTSI